MSFIRSFSDRQIQKMIGDDKVELFVDWTNKKLFEKLKNDVRCGDSNRSVFPALRKQELHFYYKGGCLFKFSCGKFKRDSRFEIYSQDTQGLDDYDKAKKQVENKFKRKDGVAKERMLLDRLNSHTFDPNNDTKVVVLDIEVNLNGSIGGGKKCDMVLLNTRTDEIAFVEGKVFGDNRVRVERGFLPEVIEQVNTYTAAVEEQTENILQQYAEHIRIINKLFGTSYNAPTKVICPAKLLVYNVPHTPTANQSYSIETINAKLGAKNVAWYCIDEEPSIDEIWETLTARTE